MPRMWQVVAPTGPPLPRSWIHLEKSCPLANGWYGVTKQRAAFVAVADQLKTAPEGFQLVGERHVADGRVDAPPRRSGSNFWMTAAARKLALAFAAAAPEGGREESGRVDPARSCANCDGYGLGGSCPRRWAAKQQHASSRPLQQPGVACGPSTLQLLQCLGLDLLLNQSQSSPFCRADEPPRRRRWCRCQLSR